MTDDDRPDNSSDDQDSQTRPPNEFIVSGDVKKRKRTRRLARRMLPELVIQRALGAAMLRRMNSGKGRPVAVVVRAPGADWCMPLAGPFSGLRTHIVVRDGSVKGENAARGSGDVAEALADGKHAVGISQTPEHLLPQTLMLVADARVEVKCPDAKMIRRLISSCVGRPPKTIPDDIAAALSFDDIVSAFRRGATPAQVVASLAAASAGKCRVSVTDTTPPLDRLPGYSADLRQWALDLAEDVAAWRRGDRQWQSISSSAILSGPPGTGKSLFARSLAATLKVPTVLSSVAAWFGTTAGYLDSVIKAVDADFASARAAAPCLLFIDELDAIPDRRRLASSKHGEWWTPLVTGILLRLDSASSGNGREGVILIGATNHIENLDGALIRPGRFDKIVEVNPPSDAVALAEIVSFHLAGALSPADIEPLARTQPGSTGADAAQWAKDASRRARAAGRAVQFDDLVAVVTTGAELSPEDRRVAAVHEAGHAVVGVAVGRRIEAVSILRKGRTVGITSMHRAGSSFLPMDEIEVETTVLLAGRAAETVVIGMASSGAESDIMEATRLVATAHGSLCLGDDLLYRGPSDKANDLLAFDMEFRRLVSDHLRRLMERTLDIVQRDRGAVEALADALVKRGYVDGVEAERIVRAARTLTISSGRATP